MSQETDSTPRELSGIQKVAVVLMQLDQDQAAEVMRQFNEFESEEIAAELLRLRRVDDEVIQRTLGEVHELATASLVGGRDAASGLLEASFGNEKATIVMNRLSSSTAGSSFEFLEGTDAAHLISLLDGELPQTAALVLGYLRPEVASQVLAGLPSQLRTQIAAALATMGTAVPEAVRVVSEELKRRTGSLVARHEPVEQVGGIQPLVDIINRSDIAVEKEILASLGQFDAALAEEVTSRLLSFADLLRFERRDIQRVLRGVNATTLAFALKGAADELEAVIRENISERTAELLDSEIAVMDRVRVSEVEAARADIVQQIRALEASGEITVRRGDGDDFVS
ncbi:flagellar motor switch protein FliG [Glutamicibacter soli]|uniref:Flagellar motor switch protein FliG n=1 Tax=Glutamicibacter soli TaxID=453836 RepID=A0A365YAJ7_9MICC|nr:flagellar motor switch protein FliG [Glutamicibacter soli]RBL99720.1 flagellar motor switch protein FliG [Glutamicibacter soli]